MNLESDTGSEQPPAQILQGTAILPAGAKSLAENGRLVALSEVLAP